MSQAQIDATGLFCQLLEMESGEINGHALLRYPNKAGSCLLTERMLVMGRSRTWVKCPECEMEQAKYVRDTNQDQIILRCPECLEVTADRSHIQTHKVEISRFLPTLLNGLELSKQGFVEIEKDNIWKLGTTQRGRGKPTTWYFARRLRSARVAERLKQQLLADKSIETCTVLTSSTVPLDSSHVLAQVDVRSLPMIGRVSKSTFHIFDDRLKQRGTQVIDESRPRTTLRFLSDGVAYVEGEKFVLEKMQIRLLQALLDDRDHEMTREALKDACGSQSQTFGPRKVFQRSEDVYDTFIQYQKGDEIYLLKIDAEKEFYD
jgi:hypothetical protein